MGVGVIRSRGPMSWRIQRIKGKSEGVRMQTEMGVMVKPLWSPVRLLSFPI